VKKIQTDIELRLAQHDLSKATKRLAGLLDQKFRIPTGDGPAVWSRLLDVLEDVSRTENPAHIYTAGATLGLVSDALELTSPQEDAGKLTHPVELVFINRS